MEKSTQSVLIFNAFTFFHASLGIKSVVLKYGAIHQIRPIKSLNDKKL